VHHSDAARADELKAELAALQRQLDEATRQESAIRAAAQSELERERALVQSTELLAPVPAEANGDPKLRGDRKLRVPRAGREPGTDQVRCSPLCDLNHHHNAVKPAAAGSWAA